MQTIDKHQNLGEYDYSPFLLGSQQRLLWIHRKQALYNQRKDPNDDDYQERHEVYRER